MTREEQKILEAAKAYAAYQSEATLAKLVTAVMDLPLKQWPAGACERQQKPQHLLKSGYGQTVFGTIVSPLKPEPGDAAYPDKIIDLETGEKQEI